MNQLVDIFCDIDDFCKAFEPVYNRRLLHTGLRQRTRQTTTDRKFKSIFTPPPPLASHPPAPPAAARSQRWRHPQHAAEMCRCGAQQGVARLCDAWTYHSGGGTGESQGFPRARALGWTGWEGWGGTISNGISQLQLGE